jgi:hypothetical protein
MRRLVFSVIAVSGLLVAGSSPALADDPAPTVSAKATPGKKICKVTDTTLDELSGIVATSSGFIVIDDGSLQDTHKKVFFLNDKCKVTSSQSYSGTPTDTEDLILSPDGKTLWIADTGDDGVRAADPKPRDHIALWSMKADGSTKPKVYRIAYPEGDYHDAEALLLQNGTTPLLVTKELGKPASIYEPSAPLKANNEDPTPLKKVGELTLSGTTTPSNTVAQIGNKTIDGGAIAPGGAKVALRTYTDALEWDVTNGDVLGALKGKPRTTGLPNEPFGEAITYSPDGKYFYTVSDMNGDHDTANYIMQYTPATTVAVAAKSADAGPTTHWYSNLTLNQITLMVGGVGLIGLILVGVGVMGIVRSRKRAALAPAAYGDGDPSGGGSENELIGVGGAPQRAGVYGGARSGGMPPAGGGSGANSGAVYGAGGGGAGGGAQRGPVYGGGGGGAPQYARPAGGQQPPARGGQPAPARGGQPAPARGGQPAPARGGQPAPARGGQPAPARGGQPAPARGGQQPPARGGQQPPVRGGQQPPRGPQPAPGRGGGGPQGGGQGRGPAPQGQRPPGGGGGQGRGPAPQGQRPQGGGGQGGGGQGQRPQGGGGGQGMPPGGGRPQRPQGPGPGQRPQDGGNYGQGQGQRPRDGRAEFGGRPEGRFDNPGYRR